MPTYPPSPPYATTPGPTPVPGCSAGCVEESNCVKPEPITCPPNEHWTECSYCTEMNCDWGMACARSCFEGGDCCVEKNKCVCDSGYARYTPGKILTLSILSYFNGQIDTIFRCKLSIFKHLRCGNGMPYSKTYGPNR